MKITKAKQDIEIKISKSLGFKFNLGELRNSEYYNDVLGYKIGNTDCETAAQLIIERMTKATTAVFNECQ